MIGVCREARDMLTKHALVIPLIDRLDPAHNNGVLSLQYAASLGRIGDCITFSDALLVTTSMFSFQLLCTPVPRSGLCASDALTCLEIEHACS